MVKCDILLRENRRTLSITIGKNCEVIVKAPYHLSETEINKILEKKHSWIVRHKARLNENNQQYNELSTYRKILYFNELYEVQESSIKNATFQNNILLIKYCPDIEKKKKEIKKWYLTTAYNILLDRLNYFASLLQLNYNTFKLTNARGKWGSCSSNKDIQLNWRLIMIESNLQDYVIVHELCHLLEMNHSSQFYRCVEAILPDYKIRRKKIKECNFLLKMF